MLSNEKYYGTFVYNREGGKRKANRVLIEHFEEVRNETAIPAIIPKKQFQKVQQILSSRMSCRPRSNANSEFFLTGYIECKSCGTSMSGLSKRGGKNKQRVRTYACPNHGVKKGKVCGTKNLNAVYIETAVKRMMKEKVNGFLACPEVQKIMFSRLKHAKTEEIKAMQKHIDRLEDEISGLVKQFANPKTVKVVAERCEAKAAESIQIQDRYKAKLEEQKKLLARIDEIESEFALLDEPLAVEDIFTSNEIARELVAIFIDKIVVDDDTDNIDIIFKD